MKTFNNVKKLLTSLKKTEIMNYPETILTYIKDAQIELPEVYDIDLYFFKALQSLNDAQNILLKIKAKEVEEEPDKCPRGDILNNILETIETLFIYLKLTNTTTDAYNFKEETIENISIYYDLAEDFFNNLKFISPEHITAAKELYINKKTIPTYNIILILTLLLGTTKSLITKYNNFKREILNFNYHSTVTGWLPRNKKVFATSYTDTTVWLSKQATQELHQSIENLIQAETDAIGDTKHG